MKIVINRCHGGFGLSKKAILRYAEIKGIELVESEPDVYTYINEVNEEVYFIEWKICRDDPVLAQVVEELGDSANGAYCKLNVVEIPDDVDWVIDDYDGVEWVAEKHRVWS